MDELIVSICLKYAAADDDDDDEFVKLSLVKSMCLPLLTYCLGALDLPQYKVRDLAACTKISNLILRQV